MNKDYKYLFLIKNVKIKYNLLIIYSQKIKQKCFIYYFYPLLDLLMLLFSSIYPTLLKPPIIFVVLRKKLKLYNLKFKYK
jgi:hypothetical protein